MGDTTITISEETKDRLETRRAPGHHSFDDLVNGLLEIVPPVEEIREGCVQCDKPKIWRDTPEDTGGVLHFFSHTYDDAIIYGSNYFCSPDCAQELQEEIQKQVPREPDEILVGGDEEMRATFTGGRFIIDNETKEVGLDVPGAFAGKDSLGNEYDYLGEPVYIRNDGKIVQRGVIDDIIHEESHTGLLLANDYKTEMLNHPNDEKREEYEEQHVEWYFEPCPECDTELRIHEEIDSECPECGTPITGSAVSDEDDK